jgi:putative nucleotidyltransferase with HDIG domain
MNFVNDIVSRVGELQPLPGTVLRLIHVVNDPRSSVDDIVETIKYDQTVTSRMLRIVNSAYFGLTCEITSLSEALRVLGTIKVLQLVMAVHTNSLLARGQRGYGLLPGKLWQHSVGVALASAVLADRLRHPNRNLLFTAGLLHDIGKVILNEYVADQFARIVQMVAEQKTSFPEAEKQILGFSHDEIGAQVGEKWRLPEGIVLGIRYHHQPDALDPPSPLVDILHMADCMCLMLGVGLGSDGLYYRASKHVTTRLGLRESDLEMLSAQVLVELKRVESLFGEDSADALGKAVARQE